MPRGAHLLETGGRALNEDTVAAHSPKGTERERLEIRARAQERGRLLLDTVALAALGKKVESCRHRREEVPAVPLESDRLG
jgi:hypothetical protein